MIKMKHRYGLASHLVAYHYPKTNHPKKTIVALLQFWCGMPSRYEKRPNLLYVHSQEHLEDMHIYFHRNQREVGISVPHEHGYPMEYRNK